MTALRTALRPDLSPGLHQRIADSMVPSRHFAPAGGLTLRDRPSSWARRTLPPFGAGPALQWRQQGQVHNGLIWACVRPGQVIFGKQHCLSVYGSAVSSASSAECGCLRGVALRRGKPVKAACVAVPVVPHRRIGQGQCSRRDGVPGDGHTARGGVWFGQESVSDGCVPGEGDGREADGR